MPQGLEVSDHASWLHCLHYVAMEHHGGADAALRLAERRYRVRAERDGERGDALGPVEV